MVLDDINMDKFNSPQITYTQNSMWLFPVNSKTAWTRWDESATFVMFKVETSLYNIRS
jgi:hypothetical protein